MFRSIRSYSVFSLLLLLAFIAGNVWTVPYKWLLMSAYQTEYGEHVFRCDNAMREHFVAKTIVTENLDRPSIVELKSAELALIDCHDYDVFRKKLLTMGLTENELSAMGLDVIERNASELSEIVRLHEIRY